MRNKPPRSDIEPWVGSWCYGLPGTPNNHVINGCLMKQPFAYIKIWNHPIETTIKNWLFGVPGTYEFSRKSKSVISLLHSPLPEWEKEWSFFDFPSYMTSLPLPLFQQGSFNYPFLGNQTRQIYGTVKGCEQFSQRSYRWIGILKSPQFLAIRFTGLPVYPISKRIIQWHSMKYGLVHRDPYNSYHPCMVHLPTFACFFYGFDVNVGK